MKRIAPSGAGSNHPAPELEPRDAQAVDGAVREVVDSVRQRAAAPEN